jgi:hypothetical protein
MPELIDRHALLKKVYEHPQERDRMTDGEWCRKCIYEAPKVEVEPMQRGRVYVIRARRNGKTIAASVALERAAEPVRHGKGCEYCKGRSYTKKPLTVTTRTMKRVEVCFNFCPNCGRDMRVTDTNVGGKGGADNG